MKTVFKSAVVAAAMATTLAVSLPVAAQKWDMPTRSNERNYMTRNIMEFAADVKKATNGKLDIVLHPENALVKQPEVKRAIQTGQVPIGEFLMSMHSNEWPVFGVEAVPFLAPTPEANLKLLNIIEPMINERLQKQGMRMLFAVPWPPQAIYFTQEVTSTAGFKDVKFRAYNPVTGRLAELMGASPVTVQQSEVPQAFSTGVITAMITSPATGVDTQAWDFVKYYYPVNAMTPWNLVVVNDRAFSRLSKAEQDAVLAAAKTAQTRGWKMQAEETDQLVETLRSKGMVVVEPSAQMMQEMQAIGQKLIEEWTQSAGEDGQKIMSQYKN
jgi:TRAP-type C4-dicarboxylate transport system substrate-binding protein